MIEAAYTRLGERLAASLVATGFLPQVTDLKIDPPGPFTPIGDEKTLIRAASLVTVRTASVRQMIGRPIPRHVVERQCRLELALAGPARLRAQGIQSDTLNAVAVLPGLNPTLDGLAERLVLGEQQDEDLEPNGLAVMLDFIIRVRSGDPLGRTP